MWVPWYHEEVSPQLGEIHFTFIIGWYCLLFYQACQLIKGQFGIPWAYFKTWDATHVLTQVLVVRDEWRVTWWKSSLVEPFKGQTLSSSNWSFPRGAKFGGFMAVLMFGRLQELIAGRCGQDDLGCLDGSMTWRRCAVVFLCFYVKQVVN